MAKYHKIWVKTWREYASAVDDTELDGQLRSYAVALQLSLSGSISRQEAQKNIALEKIEGILAYMAVENLNPDSAPPPPVQQVAPQQREMFGNIGGSVTVHGNMIQGDNITYNQTGFHHQAHRPTAKPGGNSSTDFPWDQFPEKHTPSNGNSQLVVAGRQSGSNNNIGTLVCQSLTGSMCNIDVLYVSEKVSGSMNNIGRIVTKRSTKLLGSMNNMPQPEIVSDEEWNRQARAAAGC